MLPWRTKKKTAWRTPKFRSASVVRLEPYRHSAEREKNFGNVFKCPFHVRRILEWAAERRRESRSSSACLLVCNNPSNYATELATRTLLVAVCEDAVAGFHPMSPNPQTSTGLYSPVTTRRQMQAGCDENVHGVNHRCFFVAYVPLGERINQ
jgi:hypothetical protein